MPRALTIENVHRAQMSIAWEAKAAKAAKQLLFRNKSAARPKTALTKSGHPPNGGRSMGLQDKRHRESVVGESKGVIHVLRIQQLGVESLVSIVLAYVKFRTLS